MADGRGQGLPLNRNIPTEVRPICTLASELGWLWGCKGEIRNAAYEAVLLVGIGDYEVPRPNPAHVFIRSAARARFSLRRPQITSADLVLERSLVIYPPKLAHAPPLSFAQ